MFVTLNKTKHAWGQGGNALGVTMTEDIQDITHSVCTIPF